jgi:hypothetical protein
MSVALSKAKRYFEAALNNTKTSDVESLNLIQGLIELTKALREIQDTLERLDLNTRQWLGLESSQVILGHYPTLLFLAVAAEARPGHRLQPGNRDGGAGRPRIFQMPVGRSGPGLLLSPAIDDCPFGASELGGRPGRRRPPGR